MNKISKEYAAALFALAREKGREALFGSSLETVQKLFEENPDYQELLNTPAIPAGEKARLAEKAFGKTVPKEILSAIQILSGKGYIMEFGRITAECTALLDQMNRVSAAEVRSAVSLSPAEKDRLRKKLEKLTGHSVVMTYTEDPSLLGGVVVEVDGKVIDGSVRTKLRQVKEVIGG